MAFPLKRVYLDHNATTPMRPEVRARFLEQLDRLGGNPSSVHGSGRAARAALDEAREQTAAALAVHEDEVVFTGGGTEAIQIALLGALRAAGPGAALVTSAVEHAAVLGAAANLAQEGHPVRYTPVDSVGRVDVAHLMHEIHTTRAAVVSIQTANNEIGTVMPIAEIGRRLADVGNLAPVFHTDAVQALGRLPLALELSNVDLASFSAHKIGGPLGVGILYRRHGLTLHAPFSGGGQESALRPGTENVPAISAAALAVELAVREQAPAAEHWRALSRAFWEQVHAVVPGVLLNGPSLDDAARLPNTLNLGFHSSTGREFDGRMLVARADLEGLEVSAGSACASGSIEPSHVLLALGHTPERARSSLRISFGARTTREDVDFGVEMLRRTFLSLR